MTVSTPPPTVDCSVHPVATVAWTLKSWIGLGPGGDRGVPQAVPAILFFPVCFDAAILD